MKRSLPGSQPLPDGIARALLSDRRISRMWRPLLINEVNNHRMEWVWFARRKPIRHGEQWQYELGSGFVLGEAEKLVWSDFEVLVVQELPPDDFRSLRFEPSEAERQL